MKGTHIVDLSLTVEWEVTEDSVSLRVIDLPLNDPYVDENLATVEDEDGDQVDPQSDEEVAAADKAAAEIRGYGVAHWLRRGGQYAEDKGR